MSRHALTVRQPWAWAIIHGGKTIENRGPSVAGRLRKLIGQRLAIHAGRDMSDDEFAEAAAFMRELGADPPGPDSLLYGGVIGSARVAEIVTWSSSPWFSGPFGIVLADPQESDYFECRGWPGVFKIA